MSGATEALQPWFDLQAQTLTRVHASWLPELPASLVTEARKRAIGRRWLATRLGRTSSLLFTLPAPPGPEDIEAIRRGSWLGSVLKSSLECAMDLGTLVLADAVRTVVTRTEVMQLRAALGPERYARTLSMASAAPQAASAVASGPAVALATVARSNIVDNIFRQGLAELCGCAQRIHAAWGESVRLTFERSWSQNAPQPVLSADLVESTLRNRKAEPA